ncbi:MAG: ABC transporter ATP-binding protein, partial [Clostridia bacterium]|nr:ABC transporter ATP-binding protein [Clostridia bacterium]
HDKTHDAYLGFRMKVEGKRILAAVTEVLLTAARNGIAYVYLINMALKEGLGVPEFLLYFTAVTTFTTWVMEILQATVKLHEQSLDISRVREFLEYPEPFRFEDGQAVPQTNSYELRLEHVFFRYPGAEEDTIRDLNLIVHPGEKLAIVGLNGAGKTTLVKLLSGLFDPTEGRVLLNGTDIRVFDRRAYYGLFSAVFQEFSILDVTVAENIAQTNLDIDYDRVNKCIEMAGLEKTIKDLPKGLETYVGRDVWLDGVLFSGGQTQRLMLARALYKDGPVLLLDEPTAALDPIAENDIYMKYNDMTAGKTSVFISHRLASTRFCDRIIFLADGCIAEEGTHNDLMEKNGEYAKLFEVQSRYYQEGKEF